MWTINRMRQIEMARTIQEARRVIRDEIYRVRLNNPANEIFPDLNEDIPQEYNKEELDCYLTNIW